MQMLQNQESLQAGFAFENNKRCWIKNDRDLDKLVLYFLPFLIIWIFNFAIYIAVTRTIHRVVKSEELRGRAFNRMRLYLLVFLFCVGVGGANRLQNFISPGHPLFWLNIMDAAISPLQGFLNCLVYGMNKQLRRAWYQAICCCCKDKQDFEAMNTEKLDSSVIN
eukprot:TRINITY_DN1189_c0_g1_i1.p1 TRINITY_DN1189_c0_g1~~TRINITY_DN1189_c0_g1_i1.p1  ORF type:complete len:165 (-),score=28.82 TRINITY_DN1189_c0_g1_i1:28-522(-)